MFNEPDIIVDLQANRTEFLDLLAEALHLIGGTTVSVMLVLVIFWAVHQDLGLRLIFLLLFTGLVTLVSKDAVAMDRPFIAYPDQVMALVTQETSYAFPSGHVLQATTMTGMIALFYRQAWIYIAAALYVLLSGWARMYNGVHYPIDVIGGAALGIALLVLFLIAYDPVKKLIQRTPAVVDVSVIFLWGLVILLLYTTENGMDLAGLTWGLALGMIADAYYVHFSAAGSRRQRILRAVIGVAIVALLDAGLGLIYNSEVQPALDIPGNFLIGLVAVAIYPWLAIKFGLAQSKVHAANPA